MNNEKMVLTPSQYSHKDYFKGARELTSFVTLRVKKGLKRKVGGCDVVYCWS